MHGSGIINDNRVFTSVRLLDEVDTLTVMVGPGVWYARGRAANVAVVVVVVVASVLEMASAWAISWLKLYVTWNK